MADLLKMEGVMAETVEWNRARIKFLTRFLVALIQARTVNLSQVSQVFAGRAKPESSYKRMQRFLRFFEMPMGDVARVVVRWVAGPGPWILSLDRTDWEFGKVAINILTLAVVVNGMAFPVAWKVLGKKGSSNLAERQVVVNAFLKVFGSAAIAYLCADREFRGEQWTRWLRRKGIGFRIRICRNTAIKTIRRSGAKGKKSFQIRAWFENLPVKELYTRPKTCRIWGQRLGVSGMRLPDGDLLIVITTDAPERAVADYGNRWGIETLFGCLKSRGFNLEDTHLTDSARIERLFGLLALAVTWCFCVGEWRVERNPLKIKKHERRAKSVFRTGLDFLHRLFTVNDNHSQRVDFKHVISLLSCT